MKKAENGSWVTNIKAITKIILCFDIVQFSSKYLEQRTLRKYRENIKVSSFPK